ncbi:MAG: ATP-binding cassette domain-containing protein [Actinobacteria bacterium]|nr:ATP-binding cassette domain-containing protein [Actinomycetota bacterium]
MITFANVSLIYPHSIKTVLEDLSFTVTEGEFVLVMGSTGSGKSSLLRLINGLVPHHTGGILAGDILVDGISTRNVKPGGLSHLIGIVGQNPLNGFVADRVEEEIAFGMETLNMAPEVMRKRVEEVLDLLSLADLRDRSIATLSGGEQQRVAIASALVMHPKVLVLDEPTSALDPIAAEEVLSILQRLVHDLGLTVIISEHRLERVIQFVDRIINIEGDGIAVIGSPQEILKHSAIAPPIVQLSRALKMPAISLTVREMRRATQDLRGSSIARERESLVNTSAEEVIRISKLRSVYGTKVALNDISLSVKSHEIVAVMGRNGAGKSTLLRSISGIQKPLSGEVSVLKMDPTRLKGRERAASVGYIPQEPSDLLYGQSVEGECRQADKDNGVAPGTTYEILTSLVPNISPSVHPRDLSEGQRLGLAISVVLSSNPKILILDEPTRGLDYAAKSSLISLLKTLANDGRAIIIATHDVELVAEVAQRILFLADGEIVADGPTVDVLLSSPAFAPQVAKIMAPLPWLTVNDVLKSEL